MLLGWQTWREVIRGGMGPFWVVSIWSWVSLSFGLPLNLVLYIPFGIFLSWRWWGVGGPIVFEFTLWQTSRSVLFTIHLMRLWQVLFLKEFWVTYLISCVTSQKPMLSHTVVGSCVFCIFHLFFSFGCFQKKPTSPKDGVGLFTTTGQILFYNSWKENCGIDERF